MDNVSGGPTKTFCLVVAEGVGVGSSKDRFSPLRICICSVSWEISNLSFFDSTRELSSLGHQKRDATRIPRTTEINTVGSRRLLGV